VLAVLHGARLIGHVTSAIKAPPQEIQDKDEAKTSNPPFEEWYASNQQVLGFLLSLFSKEVLRKLPLVPLLLLPSMRSRPCSPLTPGCVLLTRAFYS
jgi:hypothetical protein